LELVFEEGLLGWFGGIEHEVINVEPNVDWSTSSGRRQGQVQVGDDAGEETRVMSGRDKTHIFELSSDHVIPVVQGAPEAVECLVEKPILIGGKGRIPEGGQMTVASSLGRVAFQNTFLQLPC
jgi:hypothetical protein